MTQVYLAIDDRLTSLKTETFSKTREEKMEDLFAQKDVGFHSARCSHVWGQRRLSDGGSVCVQMEEAEMRSWIEKLQVRLQSCGLDSPQLLQVVLESLVMKKQSLCETLQYWNGRWVLLRAAGCLLSCSGPFSVSPSLPHRLQDLFQQEKGRKRLSVPPSPGRHRQTAADDSKVGSTAKHTHMS